MSANSLTQAILDYLTLRGWFCWRQNNVAVPNRKFTGLRGVSDIIGLKNGIPLAVEVKFGKDKLSEYQKRFKENWVKQGGIYIEAHCFEDVQKIL